MSRSRSSLEFMLQVLRRLMEGRVMTVADILDGAPFQDAAVRRHLDLLEQSIPEIRRCDGWPQTWRFEWPQSTQAEPFSVLSLKLARAMLGFLRGSELDARLGDLVSEHLRRLPHTPMIPHDVSRMFFAKTRMINPLGLNRNTIDVLVQCIFEQRQVLARYAFFDGELCDMTFEPYSLIFSDEGLYCYGRCVDSDKTKHIDTRRLYHVGRFQTIRATPERFPYPERDEYDPEKLFEHCFGIFLPEGENSEPEQITLRFTNRWRHYLENHRWHASQTPPTELSDGRLEIRLCLHVTHDLARWIRGLGSDVEVTAPKLLQEWVKVGVDPEYAPSPSGMQVKS